MTPLRNTKPLAGWRVLVPRGGAYGEVVAAALRSYGASPVVAPMVNFASPEDVPALSDALSRLAKGHFDWVAVTSAAVVDVLVSQGITIPEKTKVAAVGETANTALTLAGYRVDFAPEADKSMRGLLKEWPESERSGRVLVPQSDLSEPHLLADLAELGLDIEFVIAYRTVGVPVSEKVATDVADARIRAVLVSSGSVARQVQAQLAPLPETIVVACIGPRTAFDARAAGLSVHVIAEARTADSLVEGLAEYAAHESQGERD
ncbi:uroporphyrinogen-III synthase [Homoserinimonas sp. A447]